MTRDELVSWVAEHYFCDWEIERAQEVAMREGFQRAVKYLVEGYTRRGHAGPGTPTFFTRVQGRVQCYYPDTDFVVAPPDLEISIERIVRLVLEDPQQPRLF